MLASWLTNIICSFEVLFLLSVIWCAKVMLLFLRKDEFVWRKYLLLGRILLDISSVHVNSALLLCLDLWLCCRAVFFPREGCFVGFILGVIYERSLSSSIVGIIGKLVNKVARHGLLVLVQGVHWFSSNDLTCTKCAVHVPVGYGIPPNMLS